MDAKEALLLQNARFYNAFENADMTAMREIWSRATPVRCIHPGWSVIEGWGPIMESWSRIFKGDVRMNVSLRNLRAEILGRVGIVVLTEEISYDNGKFSSTGAVTATNVYAFEGSEWKLIHHHGSPMVVAAEQEGENFRYN